METISFLKNIIYVFLSNISFLFFLIFFLFLFVYFSSFHVGSFPQMSSTLFSIRIEEWTTASLTIFSLWLLRRIGRSWGDYTKTTSIGLFSVASQEELKVINRVASTSATKRREK